MISKPSDLELTESAARGNREAMEALVSRALPVVRGFARRLARDAEEGDALAQEAIVAALEKLTRYRGDSAFATWVCGIALHKQADFQRRKASERRINEHITEESLCEPAEVIADRDQVERIWLLAEKLPYAYREALIARATSDSTEQAAARLGLTSNALRVRLHRARLALRKLVLAHYPEWMGEVNNEGNTLLSV